MKQTNKCECGHTKDEHWDGNKECIYYSHYCNCKEFKSHSQNCKVCDKPIFKGETTDITQTIHSGCLWKKESHSQAETKNAPNVRASEEESLEQPATIKETKQLGENLSAPSVPHTPLTKDDLWCFEEIKASSTRIYGRTNLWIPEKDLVSALNGLRNELLSYEYIDEDDSLITISRTKFNDLLNKWFDIEVKEE